MFYFGALLGIVPGILTLSISTISILSANAVIAALQKTAVILIMPGLVGSMIASANVHAFSITIAALINFAIYCLLGAVVFRMALSKKKQDAPRLGSSRKPSGDDVRVGILFRRRLRAQ